MATDPARLAKGKQTPKALAHEPVLTPLGGIANRVFSCLSKRRLELGPQGGAGLRAITVGEVESWCRISGINSAEMTFELVYLVGVMDDEFLRLESEARQKAMEEAMPRDAATPQKVVRRR